MFFFFQRSVAYVYHTMEATCTTLQKIEKEEVLAATPQNFPADCTCLKEEIEDKSTLDISMDNRAKVMEIRDDVSYSLPQKSKGFFRGRKKLSRNMWLSIDHEKKDRKNSLEERKVHARQDVYCWKIAR